MRAIAAGISDVGLQREHNEDSFVVLRSTTCSSLPTAWAGTARVTSRAGSRRRRSSIFSATASEDVTWPFHFDTQPVGGGEPPAHGHPPREPPDLSSAAAHRASATAWARPWSVRCSAPKKRKMYIGHVGDSRATASATGRSGSSRAITRSSTTTSWRCPTSRRSSAASCPKNVITRALGMQDQVEVDMPARRRRSSGDVYVLCSDGLSGMIAGRRDPRRSSATNARHRRRLPAPHRARANEHGGEDNITAVLSCASTTALRRARVPIRPAVTTTRRPCGAVCPRWS